jgi:hypothetical protein
MIRALLASTPLTITPIGAFPRLNIWRLFEVPLRGSLLRHDDGNKSGNEECLVCVDLQRGHLSAVNNRTARRGREAQLSSLLELLQDT